MNTSAVARGRRRARPPPPRRPAATRRSSPIARCRNRTTPTGAPDRARRRHQRAHDEARGERGPRGRANAFARATTRRGCSRRDRRAAPPRSPAMPAIVSFVLRSSRNRRSKDSGTCTYGAISINSSPATVEAKPDARLAQRFRRADRRTHGRPGRWAASAATARAACTARDRISNRSRARSSRERARRVGGKRFRRRVAHIGFRNAASEAVGRAIGPEADRDFATSPGLKIRTSHQYGA